MTAAEMLKSLDENLRMTLRLRNAVARIAGEADITDAQFEQLAAEATAYNLHPGIVRSKLAFLAESAEELCYEIERCPGSFSVTQASLRASTLRQNLKELKETI